MPTTDSTPGPDDTGSAATGSAATGSDTTGLDDTAADDDAPRPDDPQERRLAAVGERIKEARQAADQVSGDLGRSEDERAAAGGRAEPEAEEGTGIAPG
jgi:hypothetical protein